MRKVWIEEAFNNVKNTNYSMVCRDIANSYCEASTLSNFDAFFVMLVEIKDFDAVRVSSIFTYSKYNICD